VPEPGGARTTSGLAIAAFVLALLWLAGLGSVLAVVLAVVARRRIRRAGGALGGEGLAVAALVLGILGVAGTAALAAAGRAVERTLERSTTNPVVRLRPGEAAARDRRWWVGTGLASVRVLGLERGVAPRSPAEAPRPDRELAAVAVEACAGPGGVQDGTGLFFVAIGFHLAFPDGVTVSPSPLGAREHDLAGLGVIPPGACRRAFLTFEVAAGAEPVAVRFEPGPFRTYVWDLRGSGR
jgi:hypothetical protein